METKHSYLSVYFRSTLLLAFDWVNGPLF